MFCLVNKRTHIPTPDDIYIGRGSPLGNPYYWTANSSAQFICKDRDEAVLLYEKYLRKEILSGNPRICDALNKLIIKKFLKQKVNLVCYCFPTTPCHGQHIIEFVENQRYCLNWFSNMRRMDKPLIYQGINYWTVENFYQAMKLDKNNLEGRQRIAQLNPFKAKVEGRKLRRDDWQEIKLDVMRVAIKHKFAPGTSWHEKLLSFNEDVVEWNNWSDVFWGKCIFAGKGENNLGKLIGEMR